METKELIVIENHFFCVVNQGQTWVEVLLLGEKESVVISKSCLKIDSHSDNIVNGNKSRFPFYCIDEDYFYSPEDYRKFRRIILSDPIPAFREATIK
jgi:hypothetical protein